FMHSFIFVNRNGVELLPIDVATLESGGSHDPENALYDYLRGSTCFEQIKLADPDKVDPSQVVDPLAQCKALYAAALKKPLLATGEAGLPSAAQFVRRASGAVTFKTASVDHASGFDSMRNILVDRIRQPLMTLDASELVSWFDQQYLDTRWI